MRGRVCIVLWEGCVGGAETLMGEMAIALRRRQMEASVLCVGDPLSLGERLLRAGVPCVGLGHRRGGAILLKPRRLAAAVRRLGADGAIVNASGYLPSMIRLGGYRGTLLAVEHGDMLNLHLAPLRRRLRVRVERWACVRSDYRDVAVSETMLEAFERATGRRGAACVHNGVDLRRFSPRERTPLARPLGERAGPVVIGVASRLAPGKGLDVLLRACAVVGEARLWRLRIAGEGPEEPRLRSLVQRERILRERVQFCGAVADMPRFWRECDVAVVASSELVESFSMAAVEAMACGLPVVATDGGALREVCGPCGTLVRRGDAEDLSRALIEHLDDPPGRAELGLRARLRVEAMFDMELMVDRYLELLGLEAAPVKVAGAPSASVSLAC